MKKGIGLLVMISCLFTEIAAQPAGKTKHWQAELVREDGHKIFFQFDQLLVKGKMQLQIINDKERIKIDQYRETRDSVYFEMPVFESGFKARKITAGNWEGIWTKGTSDKPQVMPFFARIDNPDPVVDATTHPPVNISGKWEITFTKANGLPRPAIGEWTQVGNTLRGTIQTPTGDYRFLSGFVQGDSLQMGTFDGSHAYRFVAKRNSNGSIAGIFYAGATSAEPWVAIRNENATLPDIAAMYMKDEAAPLRFRFPDLNGKKVSLSDPAYRGKVVIVQIMGSWCPNCMDETAFLSEFYDKNRQKGLEVIALAYEYSEDPVRANNSIRKFKERFGVNYKLLNTGVTVSDSLRTEKTLPQLTTIKSFPSTIFINKKGRVAKIHSGFSGPGTGSHYEDLKRAFEETVRKLLAE